MSRENAINAYRSLVNPNYSIRLFMKNYNVTEGLYSVPLYMVASIEDMIP